MISIKLLCNFIEITLQHGCSPVNLLDIFLRAAFLKNNSRRLLLSLFSKSTQFDIQYNLYCYKKHHFDLLLICHIHKAYLYHKDPSLLECFDLSALYQIAVTCGGTPENIEISYNFPCVEILWKGFCLSKKFPHDAIR